MAADKHIETTLKSMAFRRRMVPWFMGALALIICAQSMIAYARFASSRLLEPYAIWWLEPLFFRSAIAVYSGEPLYAPPNLDYTPAAYNPGLSVVGGLLFELVEPSLPVLRLFSFAMFGCLAALIAWWVYTESEDIIWSAVSLCLSLALCVSMRHISTAINCDTPFMFFGALGAYLAYKHPRSSVAVVASAIAVTIASLFKQPGYLLMPALAVYLWTVRRRGAWLFTAACAAALLVPVATMVMTSGGWYLTYTVIMPLTTIGAGDPPFFHTLFDAYPLAALSFIGCVPILTLLSTPDQRWFWAPLWVSSFAMGYLAFNKHGGDWNSLLPICWLGVLVFSLLPPLLTKRVSGDGQRWIVQATCLAIAVTAVHFQFEGVRRRADHLVQISKTKGKDAPTYPADAAFEAILRRHIASSTPPVFVGARFLDLSKPLNTHQTPLYDGTFRTSQFDITEIMEADLARHRYGSMIVWDYWKDDAFKNLLRRYYRRGKKIGLDPLIGLNVYIWTPRPDSNAE